MTDREDVADLKERVSECTQLLETVLPTLQRVAHAQAADRAAIAALLLAMSETSPDRLAAAERHIEGMADSLRPTSPEVAASLIDLLASFQQTEGGGLSEVARRRSGGL